MQLQLIQIYCPTLLHGTLSCGITKRCWNEDVNCLKMYSYYFQDLCTCISNIISICKPVFKAKNFQCTFMKPLNKKITRTLYLHAIFCVSYGYLTVLT
jgi:hypothetical protein